MDVGAKQRIGPSNAGSGRRDMSWDRNHPCQRTKNRSQVPVPVDLKDDRGWEDLLSDMDWRGTRRVKRPDEIEI